MEKFLSNIITNIFRACDPLQYAIKIILSSVSVEQCRSPDAMVLFTVMDHDVLTANDFAGEAFLGLSTIPGVTDTNASIDNFHGLKHTELPLMQQKNRSKLMNELCNQFSFPLFDQCSHYSRSVKLKGLDKNVLRSGR